MTWQEKGRKPGLNGPDKIDEKNMMKIGQLSAASGVGRSTIHHYLNLGLLPKPETAGLNVHLYGPVHLAILREIKRLREEPGMSLAEIKIWVDRQDPEVLAEKAADGAFVLPAAEETGSEVRKTGGVKREQIVETATELFSRLGYEAVRISDITDALRMSKATFYEYFQGKEQLFIECIERLTVDIVPREGWQSIREERDYFKRQRLRARQFLESFPGYSGILQQARLFSRIDNPEMAAKARETFHIMTRPMKKDLIKARERGAIRPFDPEIGAHMLLGLVEGLGWKMMADPSLDIDRVLDSVIDLLKYGLSPAGPMEDVPPEPDAGIGAVIRDVKGVETTVEQPLFDGQDYLEVRIGEASVRVEPGRLGSLKVEEVEAGRLKLSLASRGDRLTAATVPGSMKVSGRTPFGEISIPLEKVAEVVFRASLSFPDS